MISGRLESLVTEHPFFKGFASRYIELMVGSAAEMDFEPREIIFRAGEEAKHFYLLRHGRVAIEVFSHERGPVAIETVDAGEVLGWSWLVEPYQWHFDAQAIESTEIIAFDAQVIRQVSAADPPFGYALLSRFRPLIVQRLEATRIQLLDLYHVHT